jgi:hypothetical protein
MRMGEFSAQSDVARSSSKLFGWSRIVVCIAGVWPIGTAAQSMTQLCQPQVSDLKTVVTAAQRKAAGKEAIPPITDLQFPPSRGPLLAWGLGICWIANSAAVVVSDWMPWHVDSYFGVFVLLLILRLPEVGPEVSLVKE